MSASVIYPTGMILPWMTDTAPDGWVLCYGQALDASADSSLQDLYDLIGTTFGGTDNTDFQTPDLRGRFPLIQDDLGGTSADRVTDTEADTIGQSNGAEDVALTSSEMPSHSHTKASGGASRATEGGSSRRVNSGTSSSSGSGNAHNNMNPYLTGNYCIKK